MGYTSARRRPVATPISTSSRVSARAAVSVSALSARSAARTCCWRARTGRLAASLVRHCDRAIILSDMEAGRIACTRIGGPLLLGGSGNGLVLPKCWASCSRTAVLNCRRARRLRQRPAQVQLLHTGNDKSGRCRAAERRQQLSPPAAPPNHGSESREPSTK
jgi:hypothetical protein